MQTFSVLGLRPVFLALGASGHDPAKVLRDAGVEPERLADPDARVPTTVAFDVFERATRVTDDDAFGLRAAESIPDGVFEVVDVAARSCATIGAALARISRYYTLIDDGAELEIVRRGGLATVVHKNIHAPPLAAIEALFALMLLRARRLTGREVALRAVRFRNAAPRDPSEHERFFGVPVVFGWPQHEIEVEVGWLDTAIRSADPAVSSFVERFLRTITSQRPAAGDLTGRVRRAIAESISAGEPTLEMIARKLVMSTRTLQRKLRAAHQSYADIVDEVRREIALAQLAERTLSIAEIGYLLGFSEPSAFHRAFRRWTGLAPSEYRKLHAV